MGKHKKKTKKHRKDKTYDSSSEEEWVEKKILKIEDDIALKKKFIDEKGKSKRHHSSYSEDSSENEKRTKKRNKSAFTEDKPYDDTAQVNRSCARDKWMNLPTNFSSSSSSDRRSDREIQKKLEREKEQYNPRESVRELNPYWKGGGDGLPTFKKPVDSDDEQKSYKSYNNSYSNRTSSWKKKKHIEQDEPSEKSEKITRYDAVNSAISEDTVFSEKELNTLAAKLVKAEIMGNSKLVQELKEKLEKARSQVKESNSTPRDEGVMLTHTDSQGRSQPLKLQAEYEEFSKKQKKKRIETHEGGQRVRYFPDDDEHSLKQMFESEKYNSVEDQNKEFLRMTSKVSKNDDLDDIFSDNIRNKESTSKVDSRNRDRAIQQHESVSKSLDNCNKCIQSELMLKHLMISMGETAYLALPAYEPLTEGHCMIIPVRHVPCSTQLDENEWSDIINFRRSLTNLFKANNEDVIFFEIAMKLHKYPHMYLECIPLPKEQGDLAPIYFKKAIDESEYEWSLNKKLISLKGRDVRRAVPKGLPYFSVSFGMEEGFAHIIEDEKCFPSNFAQEIIGGMLDLHHSKWRKPKKQSFKEQSDRVLQFSKEWKNFDCTL